jgi:hypothetical protein
MGAAAFQTASFAGLGAVAIWCYVKFPNRRPATIPVAMAHVVISFAFLSVQPLVAHIYGAHVPGKLGFVAFLVTLLMPTLCYVFLSWLWLIGRIVQGIGTPRGGHPVREGA